MRKKGIITVCTVMAVLTAVLAAGCRPSEVQLSSGNESSGQETGQYENSGTIQGVIEEMSPEEQIEEEIEQYLSDMTLEEKAAQLFVVTPEALTHVGTVTAAGERTREALEAYPVGGLVYLKQNLVSESQTRQMLENTQEYSGEIVDLPTFLTVDEEGGTVARIAGNDGFAVEDVGNMADIGAAGDPLQAYQVGKTIGAYLSELGFNVDFAPVADVLTNPENTVIGSRSFGSDSQLVTDMVLAEMKGLAEGGVLACVKHFPGHGATEADTHEGYAWADRTLEELRISELVPFEAAADAGVPFLMVSHISVPRVTGDDTPASLSEFMVKGLIREQMDYDGIVITDALNMGAVAENYTSAQAAVLALEAGVDMLLMPEDFEAAYQGVITAVHDNTLTEERINESVRRILRVKLSMQTGPEKNSGSPS